MVQFLYYNQYLKKRKISNEEVFVSKTAKSYLIGPKINFNFDEDSFYKRMISSSIFTKKIYRCFSKKKCILLIDQYYKFLGDNEVIEVLKNGDVVKHSIISLPGGLDEKK